MSAHYDWTCTLKSGCFYRCWDGTGWSLSEHCRYCKWVERPKEKIIDLFRSSCEELTPKKLE